MEEAAFSVGQLGAIRLTGKVWDLSMAQSQHATAYRRWSPEDDDELLRDFNAGWTPDDLARDFEPEAKRDSLALAQAGRRSAELCAELI